MQEDIHNEDNEDDGFNQGLHHFVDGGVEEVLRTHQVGQYQSFWQLFGYFCSQFVDFFNDFVGIGTGCLRNHTSGTRMTVDLTVVGITLGTKFNFSNILQTEYFTV